jgi:hypothetical protein
MKRAALPLLATAPALAGVVLDGGFLTLVLVVGIEVALAVAVSRRLASKTPPLERWWRALDLAAWLGGAGAFSVAALLASAFPAGLGSPTPGRRLVLGLAALAAFASVAIVLAPAPTSEDFGRGPARG